MCVCAFVPSSDSAGWQKGVKYADGQNLARLLMEAPANHVTPTAFANTIEERLAVLSERVTVNKRYVNFVNCMCIFVTGKKISLMCCQLWNNI